MIRPSDHQTIRLKVSKSVRKISATILNKLLGRWLYDKLINWWYNSNILNKIRKKVNFLKIKSRYKFRFYNKELESLKLHLGCGRHYLEGYVNIDAVKSQSTDLIYDVSEKLPYPDNSVEIITCSHLLEHLPVCLMANIEQEYGEKYASVIKILKEWQRVLIPTGKLIIELPDFDGMVEEYVKADISRQEELICYIYGGYRFNNIYDIHRWGPNKYRLTYILEKAGFRNIEFKESQGHHKEFCPCLRVECIK
ncbi:MAG: methyltransferase domain-containing protein [Candidatus Stahlbacteria bacterium]|nr:methyltransferase domain-containing protein [Candidatus Stahlbacteria bacterium]